MPTRNVHIVHRRILDISTDSQSVADAFMGQTGEMWAQTAAHVDEALFSALAPGDGIHLIDRLEVDMGVLPPDLDPDDLAAHYQDCLAAALEDADEPASYAATQGNGRGTEVEAAHGANHPAGEGAPSAPLLDAALHFLATGSLPWWIDTGGNAATGTDDRTVRETLVAALQHAVAHEKARLQDWLDGIRAPNRVIRLCRLQLDAGLADQLAGLIAGTQTARMASALQEQTQWMRADSDSSDPAHKTAPVPGQPVQPAPVQKTEDGHRPLTAGLETPTGGTANTQPNAEQPEDAEHQSEPSSTAPETPGRPRSGTRRADASGTQQPQTTRRGRKERHSKPSSEPATDEPTVLTAAPSDPVAKGPQPSKPGDRPPHVSTDGSRVESRDQTVRAPLGQLTGPERPAVQGPRADERLTDRRPAHQEARPSGSTPGSDRAHRPVQHQAAGPPPTTGTAPPFHRRQSEETISVPVECAGSILLAAFLPTFLARVSLRDDAGWCTEGSAVRGAQLVHYLATGSTQTPQFAMQVPMLMCGVPFETPVPLELAPSDPEQEASRGLLTAMLNHWTPLSGTRIDGLRETFLMRPGLLTEEEDHWFLRLERGPFDMLLDQLPWCYRTVGLSWMSKFLEVEW